MQMLRFSSVHSRNFPGDFFSHKFTIAFAFHCTTRCKMLSALVKLRKRENDFFMHNKKHQFDFMVVLSPIHQRNSYLYYRTSFVICLFALLCNFNFCPSQQTLRDTMSNKFGIKSRRCCVTAWELCSELSRDFDFEGKSSIVFAAAMKRERNGARDVLITKLSYALKLKICK